MDGQSWEQDAFPQQAKCLVWLRNAYAALDAADAARVDRVLHGTGCAALFAGL